LKPRFELAKHIGRDFFNKYCIQLSYPLDVEYIASIIGVSIIPCDLHGEESYTMHAKRKGADKYKIAIDNSYNEQRVRFTLSHELGHIIMGHFKDYRISTLSEGEKLVLDKEADVVAGEILMPLSYITKYKNSVETLQIIFDVSLPAIKTRLKFLDIKASLNKPKPINYQLSENEKKVALLRDKWLYDF